MEEIESTYRGAVWYRALAHSNTVYISKTCMMKSFVLQAWIRKKGISQREKFVVWGGDPDEGRVVQVRRLLLKARDSGWLSD